MADDIVWEAKLDDIYECAVTRVADFAGVLTIKKDGETLFENGVPIMYNAVFGPDIADLTFWQNSCIEFIDGESE